MKMLIAVVAAILVAGTVASPGWGRQLTPGPEPAVGARGIPPRLDS